MSALQISRQRASWETLTGDLCSGQNLESNRTPSSHRFCKFDSKWTCGCACVCCMSALCWTGDLAWPSVSGAPAKDEIGDVNVDQPLPTEGAVLCKWVWKVFRFSCVCCIYQKNPSAHRVKDFPHGNVSEEVRSFKSERKKNTVRHSRALGSSMNSFIYLFF